MKVQNLYSFFSTLTEADGWPTLDLEPVATIFLSRCGASLTLGLLDLLVRPFLESDIRDKLAFDTDKVSDFITRGVLPRELNSARLLAAKENSLRKIVALERAIAGHRHIATIADELFALQNPNA